MPATGTAPELLDIYLLEQQLQADRSSSLEQLRERDHSIGLECPGQKDTQSLLHWLARVSRSRSDADDPWLNERHAALVLRLVAAATGLMAMAGLLLASDRALVNVLLLLAFFVLVPLALTLVSAWALCLSVRGAPPAVSPLNPARFVARWALPDRNYLAGTGSLLRLLVLKYAQEAALLFALGAIVAFLVLLAFKDFSFVWGSTFGFSDHLVGQVVGVLASPWAALFADATVTPQIIADTRYHGAQSGLGDVSAHSRRGWWPFLLLCLVCYALLPRLLLWLLSRRAYRRELDRAFLAVPGAGSVLARMRTPVVTTRARDEIHEDRDGPAVIREQGAVLLEWAGALAQSAVRWEVDAHLQAGLGSPGEDLDCIEAINRMSPRHLLLAVKGWEPPMADLADVLAELVEIPRCSLQLVSLPGRELGESSFRDWQAFADGLPFASTELGALEEQH